MKKLTFKMKNVSRETFFARASLIFTVFCIASLAFGLRHSVYNIYINDNYVASVQNKDVFHEAKEQIENTMRSEFGNATVQFHTEIKKCFSIGEKSTIDAETLATILLTEIKKLQTDGYNIYIDGNYIAVAADEQTIRCTMEKTEKMYIKLNDFLGGDKCEGIADSIRIVPCKTAVGNLKNEEKLLEIFGYFDLEKQYEQALSAEFFSEEIIVPQLSLSAKNRDNTSVPESSPTITPTVFTFEKSHEETMTLDVPFGVEKIYTSELSKGTTELCKNGIAGKKTVNYTVYTTDGIETSRRKNGETRLSEPQNCVMLVGTYEKCDGDGYPENYGKFLLPCTGVKSSGYGMRNLFGQTSLHKGCDIAAPCGTDITCAASGVVKYAGENGNGYGIHVVVEHPDGFSTLYAHMRECFAKTGDEVLIGQKIGEVGLTGNTTGFHLHFEILKDGVPMDPEKFIRVE